METLKKFLFQETEILKTSYISGSNFPSSKNKKKTTLNKILIFREMELSYFNIKKTSYIFSKESFSDISGNGNPE